MRVKLQALIDTWQRERRQPIPLFTRHFSLVTVHCSLITTHAAIVINESRKTAIRQWLALLRLLLVYGALCSLAALALPGIGQVDATSALVSAPPAASRAPAMQIPRLGVTVQLDALSTAARRRALQRLAQHGVGWVRQRLAWTELEPAPGHFDWEESDAILAEITAAGLVPVVVLDGSPAWARTAQDRAAGELPLAPPATPATFARFAAAFAQRYATQLRFYQIWDEPNIFPHWGNRWIEPLAYAQLLRAASQAIRDADADAVILLAALAPNRDRGHLAIDDVYYLQRLYAAGAAPYFDVVAAQPFGFGDAPTTPSRSLESLNFQRMLRLRAVMVAAGDGETPIWAVRFGWNSRTDSPWGTVARADQLRYAREALRLTAAWRWLPALGWVIDQPAAHDSDPSWGFALNDELLQTLETASTEPPLPITTESSTAATWFSPMLLALALLLGWRGMAAARQAPWQQWANSYRCAPAALRWLAWGALLVIYYLTTWPPLIAACWMSAMLLALAQPTAAVTIAAVVLPFYYQHKELRLGAITLSVAPMVAMALALTPATGRELLANNRTMWPLRSSSVTSPWQRAYLVVLAGWLGLNLVGAINVWQWPAFAQAIVELVLTPLILSLAAWRSERPRRVLVALYMGGLLVAVIGLVRWLSGSAIDVDGVQRLVGPHFSPNHTALYLVRTLIVGLGIALSMRSVTRWAWLAVSGFVALALLLTASRGAILLGAPAGCAACLWLWLTSSKLSWGAGLSRLRRHRLVQLTLLLLPLAALITVILGEARLLNTDTVSSRILIWQAGWRMWQAHPWIGVGPGGFFWSFPAYLAADAVIEPNLTHPHNVWLEMASIWGLAGLLWLVGALAALWLGVSQRIRTLPDGAPWLLIGIVGAFVAGLAHGQVDAFMALPDLAGWNFMAFGLWGAFLLEREARKSA